MSLSAASKCPFLTRVSTNYLQKSGSSLGMYGQRCPVMSKLFHTASRAAGGGSSAPTTGKQPLSLGEDKKTVLCKCRGQIVQVLYTACDEGDGFVVN